MSKKCRDQSDIILERRIYVRDCPCDCDNQHHGFTPLGYMCDKCGHIQKKNLRVRFA